MSDYGYLEWTDEVGKHVMRGTTEQLEPHKQALEELGMKVEHKFF